VLGANGQAGQTAKTRAADASLIMRAKRLLLDGDVSQRRLMNTAKVSQHSFERFLRSERVHPPTRARVVQAVEQLDREFRKGNMGKRDRKEVLP
jgi:hypothetical protein